MLRLHRSLLLLLLGLPGLARAQTEGFGLGKVIQEVQTSPTTLVPEAAAPVQFNALSSLIGSLTTPAGASTTLSYVAADADYEVLQTFGSQALMDAAFPSGQYIFNVEGATVPLTLTGDLYPPVPQLMGGTWNASGQLVVDPTQDYNFSFSPFLNYATAGAGGQVDFTIETSTGTPLIELSYFSPQIPAVPDGYTLASGSLQAGTTYTGILAYGIDTVAIDSEAYGLLLSAYGRATRFTIVAQGPPAVPLAVSQPQSQTIATGATVVFAFTASGSPLPAYQWFRNGVAITGAAGTQSTLVVSSAAAANAGTYTCTATNASGSVTSSAATLALSATTDVGRLVNLSCRADIAASGSVLTTGFVVGGAGTAGTDSLLIRASGPALGPLGVSGFLADPELGFYDSGSVKLASNQGWGGAADVAAAAAQVGAFSWSNAGSHDAAFVETPAAGAYTTQIASVSNGTGVTLAEIYDTTPAGTYTANRPRLINLSALFKAGTGGNILIAGFVIGGSTSKTVLIRASGPALAAFSVSGTLADPKLQLYSGSSTVLATNIGWGANPQIIAAAAEVGAFAWNALGSADSAILVTLPPGAYTAQVSGASGDTGVALVEVYDVP